MIVWCQRPCKGGPGLLHDTQGCGASVSEEPRWEQAKRGPRRVWCCLDDGICLADVSDVMPEDAFLKGMG